MQRRRDREQSPKTEAPAERQQRDRGGEAPPSLPPRRGSVIHRGNGQAGDMGDWVIDDAE